MNAMARSSYALQPLGNGFWAPYLDNKVDVADINSQFKGGGGYDALELPVLQLVLHFYPGFLTQ